MFVIISGKARHGKDTLGKFLAKELYDKEHSVYYLMAYGDELKRDLIREFHLSWDQLWGDLKETPDERFSKTNIDGSIITNEFWTPREIMQFYGQAMRTINPNFWVNRLFNVVSQKNYKNIIITDARHKNEVDAIVSRGGVHIRINREESNTTKIHGMDHVSENAVFVDGIQIDIVVNNFGTLKDLENSAKDVAEQIQTIKKIRGENKNG